MSNSKFTNDNGISNNSIINNKNPEKTKVTLFTSLKYIFKSNTLIIPSNKSDHLYIDYLSLGIDPKINSFNINDVSDNNCYNFLGLFRIGCQYSNSEIKTCFLELISLDKIPSNNKDIENIVRDGYSIFSQINLDLDNKNNLCPESYLLLSKHPHQNLELNTGISKSENSDQNLDISKNENTGISKSENSNQNFTNLSAFKIIINYFNKDINEIESVIWKNKILGGNGEPPRIKAPKDWYLNGGDMSLYIYPITTKNTTFKFTSLIAINANNESLNIYSANAYSNTKFNLLHQISLNEKLKNEPIFIQPSQLSLKFICQEETNNLDKEKKFDLSISISNSNRMSLITKSADDTILNNVYLYFNIINKFPQLSDKSRNIEITDNIIWKNRLLYTNGQFGDSSMINVPKNTQIINRTTGGDMSNFYLTVQNVELTTSKLQILELSLLIPISELDV